MPKASIVIPTLNEEKNMNALLRQINLKEYEVIIVDGHSTDKTVEIAKKFGIKVLYDDKGKGSALRKGMNASAEEIVITMDADLSHRISELGLLVEAINSGYDICMGSRFILGGGTDDMPLHRKIGNKLFVFLVNSIWRANYSDLCYGYRSFRRDIIKKLNLESDGFGIETEISIKSAKQKLKIIEIPSFEKKRMHGTAKLHSLRDGWEILKRIMKEVRV